MKETENIPGPGAYNLAVSKAAMPPPRSRAQARPRLPQGARFDTMGSQNDVGPGSHDISGSLIKKTFNVTFGGASTPAGAGRVVHRTAFRKAEELRRKLSDGAPLHPVPGATSGGKESLPSPRASSVVPVAP